MRIPSNIKFKKNELIQEYQQISSKLQLILEDMAGFVRGHGYEFIITDLLSDYNEDIALHRVSRSHTEGRACDIRVIDWTEEFRLKFEQYFENKYKDKAAISSLTLKPNLIEIHNNGNGLHCHIQVKK